MGSAAFWFFIIGLILLALAFFEMAKIRTFSFKNKKVIVKEKLTFFLGGAGFVLLFYGFLIALF